MKLLLHKKFQHRAKQPARRHAPAINEALRLAAELLDMNGDWPEIDMAGACLRHWNGHAITLARSDLTALRHRGLLDDNGRWTESGRRALAHEADLPTPGSLALG